jgi:hypothetical protein
MLRHTVGLVGLLAALHSGIGWMSNLRGAVSEQCAQVPETPALPKRLLADLLSLLGLGVADRLARDHRVGVRVRRVAAGGGQAGRAGVPGSCSGCTGRCSG